MFKSDLNETAFEQSRQLTLFEICAVFQITPSLLFSAERIADEFDKYCTALLFAENGGWKGDRRPDV